MKIETPSETERERVKNNKKQQQQNRKLLNKPKRN